MVKAIFAIAGGVAFVSVMLGFFAAGQMLRHKKPGVSTLWFGLNGWAFFTGRNFEPPAEPSRRLFMLCAIAFVVAMIAFVAFGLIGWPPPPPPTA